MQDMDAFNLQLQMHKYWFDVKKILNTNIWNDFGGKKGKYT